jgi:hypothetical protein
MRGPIQDVPEAATFGDVVHHAQTDCDSDETHSHRITEGGKNRPAEEEQRCSTPEDTARDDQRLRPRIEGQESLE